MQVFLIVLGLVITAGIIFLLHRYQISNRADIVERSAPLGTLDLQFADPDDVEPKPAQPAAISVENILPSDSSTPSTSEKSPAIAQPSGNTDKEENSWLDTVKLLREQAQWDEGLSICRQQFPRIQAFQQGSIILRHQIKELIVQHKPVTEELKKLYTIAVLADLYRSSNPLKPKNPKATLQRLQQCTFEYKNIGSRYLRLLTKSDIRHLEQLWGRASKHQHVDEALGAQWLELCQ